jgi:Zn-dependent protease
LDQFGFMLFALPILLFSVIVHECSHGLVALWRGDTTARDAGRLTLNPIPHIDPVGSILLPGMMLMLRTGMLFGWAKPVPVNVHNLHNPASDSIKVAVAGPLSNILLAFVFALAISLGVNVFHWTPRAFIEICGWGIRINCLLAVFNLLPIPPLDGHWVLMRYLPPQAAMAYQRIGFMGIILILVIFNIEPLRYWLLQVPVSFLMNLVLRLAGVPL